MDKAPEPKPTIKELQALREKHAKLLEAEKRKALSKKTREVILSMADDVSLFDKFVEENQQKAKAEGREEIPSDMATLRDLTREQQRALGKLALRAAGLESSEDNEDDNTVLEMIGQSENRAQYLDLTDLAPESKTGPALKNNPEPEPALEPSETKPETLEQKIVGIVNAYWAKAKDGRMSREELDEMAVACGGAWHVIEDNSAGSEWTTHFKLRPQENGNWLVVPILNSTGYTPDLYIIPSDPNFCAENLKNRSGFSIFNKIINNTKSESGNSFIKPARMQNNRGEYLLKEYPDTGFIKDPFIGEISISTPEPESTVVATPEILNAEKKTDAPDITSEESRNLLKNHADMLDRLDKVEVGSVISSGDKEYRVIKTPDKTKRTYLLEGPGSTIERSQEQLDEALESGSATLVLPESAKEVAEPTPQPAIEPAPETTVPPEPAEPKPETISIPEEWTAEDEQRLKDIEKEIWKHIDEEWEELKRQPKYPAFRAMAEIASMVKIKREHPELGNRNDIETLEITLSRKDDNYIKLATELLTLLKEELDNFNRTFNPAIYLEVFDEIYESAGAISSLSSTADIVLKTVGIERYIPNENNYDWRRDEDAVDIVSVTGTGDKFKVTQVEKAGYRRTSDGKALRKAKIVVRIYE